MKDNDVIIGGIYKVKSVRPISHSLTDYNFIVKVLRETGRTYQDSKVYDTEVIKYDLPHDKGAIVPTPGKRMDLAANRFKPADNQTGKHILTKFEEE